MFFKLVFHLVFFGEKFREPFLNELVEEFLDLFVFLFGNPTFDERTPSQIIDVYEDHTSSTDGSRWGDCQILNFKNETDLGGEWDSVTIQKCQHLVIVEDSIHGLDPKSINRTIKDHPSLGFWFFLAESWHHWWKNSFVPLQIAVNITEKLFSINWFRVQVFVFYSRIFFVLLWKGVHSAVQNLPDCWFTTLRSTHQHVTMTRVFRIIKLNYFLHLLRFNDQIHFLKLFLNCRRKFFIGNFLHLNVREKIIKQWVKQWNIFFNKFRKVHVSDGFHQNQYFLIELLFLQFFYHLLVFLINFVQRRLDVCFSPNCTCTCQNWLYGSQTKIIVVLFWQLLCH